MLPLYSQAALYEEWDSQVFSKIQGRLQRAVSGVNSKELEARLKVRGRVNSNALEVGSTIQGLGGGQL